MEIVILRLGHRLERDKRVTTHVGLVGRALGAQGMLLAAEDKGVQSSINRVTKRWGGDFFVETGVNRSETIRNWKRRDT
jgi:tRNA (cytidine56-2'-O)-methyltransferase